MLGRPTEPVKSSSNDAPEESGKNIRLLYLAVGTGSALGGSARWLMSEWTYVWLGTGFPWATLLVNTTGSFLIGLVVALVGPGGRFRANPLLLQFIVTGFCGGYTTFSLFSLETMQLIGSGALSAAGLNMAASLGTWLLAVWAGHALGCWLTDRGD